MPAPLPWPASLADSPAISVLERALSRSRLSHSILLQGEDLVMLQAIALAIADRLLNTPKSSAPFPPDRHPDCFFLRPAGKMRQIGAEPTRELISKVQVSSVVSSSKVGIIIEADRMNTAAANIFLKTLEEPPRDTTLILLTTKPYALLPTIRSRVQYFRFPAPHTPTPLPGWAEWMTLYQEWLAKLASGTPSKKGAAEHIMGAYSLIARFALLLDSGAETAWKALSPSLPKEIPEEEQTAIKAGLANGLRASLFADIERATRDFAVGPLTSGDEAVRQPLTSTVDALERSFRLLGVNLNEAAALEDFLLASLRIWSRR